MPSVLGKDHKGDWMREDASVSLIGDETCSRKMVVQLTKYFVAFDMTGLLLNARVTQHHEPRCSMHCQRSVSI